MKLKNILLPLLALLLAFAPAAEAQNAPAAAPAAADVDTLGPLVRLETNVGNITVRLFNDTPLHRDNFLRLARQGYYDGLLFHRVIKRFMIQGGDPDSRGAEPGKHLGEGGPGYTIPAEIDAVRHFHRRGALAAAREGDNVNPDRASSGSQFYIVWGAPVSTPRLKEVNGNIREATGGKWGITPESAAVYRRLGGTPHLDGQYTVFGEVVDGLDIVEKIQAVATDEDDRPLVDVEIRRAVVVRGE